MRRTKTYASTALKCSTVLLLVLGLLSCTADKGLDWQEEEGYRWAKLEPGYWGSVGFNRIETSKSGVDFTNRISEKEVKDNQHYLNGSGVAAGDINGDGLVDLYFGSLNGPNRLYKNTGGFNFEEITESSGVLHKGHYSTGVILEDIDGDSDLDIIVGTISDGVTIYENVNGKFNFNKSCVLEEERGKGNMTLSMGDINKDGMLDLYVTNYKERTVKSVYGIKNVRPKDIIKGFASKGDTTYRVENKFRKDYKIIRSRGNLRGVRETGERDALYLNDGEGCFEKADSGYRFKGEDVSDKLPKDWGLHSSVRDINGDGHLDIYVNNDFWTPDRLWINQGDGTFRSYGDHSIRNQSLSSMGAAFSDINRNGETDIFVTDMLSRRHEYQLSQRTPNSPFPTRLSEAVPQYHRNSLYLNRGDNTYAEISYFSGVEASEWSWSTRFMDVDLDGYEDLLINTGFSYDYQDLDTQQQLAREWAQSSTTDRSLTEYPTLHLKNIAFRNNGNLTFSEVSKKWGLSGSKDVSHGLATADFDNDGDLDLVISRLNDHPSIYENTITLPRIAVKLSGKRYNTRGIGAKIYLEPDSGNVASQRRQITTGDYLSSSASTVMFAANPHTEYTITVEWNDGTRKTVNSVIANRIYEIRRPSKTNQRERKQQLTESVFTPSRQGTQKNTKRTTFVDVSDRISHTHQEETFNDFSFQPLLPITLSNLGPGVSWIDYDMDGDDDLFITSGKGGSLAVYENDGDGSFRRRSLEGVTRTSPADQTAILGWPTDRGVNFIIGNSNYEQGIDAPAALTFSYRNESVLSENTIPGIRSTTGPLAAADYNNDGNIDIFVGGRFVPARYPSSPSSRLFENRGGSLSLDKENSTILEDIGMVTGAVFTDYNQDGETDLLLSRSWGSLLLFENEDGLFRNVTSKVGLDELDGWWQGISTGDFNNDGLPDIVATNLGKNNPYYANIDKPIRMYHSDFDNNGIHEILEFYYSDKHDSYLSMRKLVELKDKSIPFLSNIDSNKKFANMGINDLMNPSLRERMGKKQINTLQTSIFMNRDGHFTHVPLPKEAQFSSAHHPGVADYNNDGNEDIFLSQNFFQVRPKMPRFDAGRGLWLKGDGNGEFEAVPGHVSGIRAYGEQRGAALGDFNQDGRVDLVISQNEDTTKLYKNRTPKPGLTVHLNGPASNRAGIGSSIRLVYPDGTKGPRREVRVGAGYWSQSSTTQIMGYSRYPAQIEVTWFSGEVQTIDVTDSDRYYTIDHDSMK